MRQARAAPTRTLNDRGMGSSASGCRRRSELSSTAWPTAHVAPGTATRTAPGGSRRLPYTVPSLILPSRSRHRRRLVAPRPHRQTFPPVLDDPRRLPVVSRGKRYITPTTASRMQTRWYSLSACLYLPPSHTLPEHRFDATPNPIARHIPRQSPVTPHPT